MASLPPIPDRSPETSVSGAHLPTRLTWASGDAVWPPRPSCQQPFRSQGQPCPSCSGLQSGVFLDPLLFLSHPCPVHQQSPLVPLKVTPGHTTAVPPLHFQPSPPPWSPCACPFPAAVCSQPSSQSHTPAGLQRGPLLLRLLPWPPASREYKPESLRGLEGPALPSPSLPL